MRKCIRCGTTMIENCGIKIKGAAYGIVLTDDESKWWRGRMEEPKVAIYLENVEKIKKKA